MEIELKKKPAIAAAVVVMALTMNEIIVIMRQNEIIYELKNELNNSNVLKNHRVNEMGNKKELLLRFRITFTSTNIEHGASFECDARRTKSY